jgi:hypothetical protein
MTVMGFMLLVGLQCQKNKHTMDNIFPIYFNMFDCLLKDRFDNKVTREFKNLIIETKNKLIETFNLDPKYSEYCKVIDENFNQYLRKFE